MHGTETLFSLASADDARTIVLGRNIYFTSFRYMASSINQTEEMAATTNYKSFLLNCVLNSTRDNLSFLIDIKRLTTFIIQNRVSNPTVSNTSTFTGDGSTTSFTLGATLSSGLILCKLRKMVRY